MKKMWLYLGWALWRGLCCINKTVCVCVGLGLCLGGRLGLRYVVTLDQTQYELAR